MHFKAHSMQNFVQTNGIEFLGERKHCGQDLFQVGSIMEPIDAAELDEERQRKSICKTIFGVPLV